MSGARSSADINAFAEYMDYEVSILRALHKYAQPSDLPRIIGKYLAHPSTDTDNALRQAVLGAFTREERAVLATTLLTLESEHGRPAADERDAPRLHLREAAAELLRDAAINEDRLRHLGARFAGILYGLSVGGRVKVAQQGETFIGYLQRISINRANTGKLYAHVSTNKTLGKGERTHRFPVSIVTAIVEGSTSGGGRDDE